jgi:predicted RNase H-like HicB family nuclease
MKYAVIYEKTNTGYSAYLPDLPGCISTGQTLGQTRKRMEKVVEMHIAAMKADGDAIAIPTTEADYVDVPGYTVVRHKHLLALMEASARAAGKADKRRAKTKLVSS